MNRKEKILLNSSNIWNFSYGMFGPLLAVFAERIGGNIFDVTWAWAIYLIVTGACSLLVGRFSDHHSKEKILVLGFGLSALFTFAYIFVQTPIHLFLVQAGLGVSLALCNPTWYALYNTYAAKQSTGRIWGLADGEGKMLTGIAIIVGGFIVSHFSFRTLFLIMGSLQTFNTFYQARILSKKK